MDCSQAPGYISRFVTTIQCLCKVPWKLRLIDNHSDSNYGDSNNHLPSLISLKLSKYCMQLQVTIVMTVGDICDNIDELNNLMSKQDKKTTKNKMKIVALPAIQ